MSKWLKQSGASFRKSKKVKDLAASGEGCSKISVCIFVLVFCLDLQVERQEGVTKD